MILTRAAMGWYPPMHPVIQRPVLAITLADEYVSRVAWLAITRLF